MPLQAPANSGLQSFIASGLQVRGISAGSVWVHARVVIAGYFMGERATDLSNIREVLSGSDNLHGIGGDSQVIWAATVDTIDTVEEYATSDFALVRSVAAPVDRDISAGAGGDRNTFWLTKHNAGPALNKVYELSVVDFSVSRSADAPGGLTAAGIGGDADTLWYCSAVAPLTTNVLELSVVDFSSIRSNTILTVLFSDIGGDAGYLCACSVVANRATGHILDPATLSIISTIQLSNLSSSIFAMGGGKI